MMSVDIDIIKARANNEYRLSKVRGEAMISVRIPGGILPAHLLTVAREIAETWGNGQIHLCLLYTSDAADEEFAV